MTRISWRAHARGGEEASEYQKFHSVLSVLSYMLKVSDNLLHSIQRK